MADRNAGTGEASGDFPDSGSAPMRSVPPGARGGNNRAICVFCGSSPGNDPAYPLAARQLGQAIGENGYTLVFGGGGVGLMGEVARAAPRRRSACHRRLAGLSTRDRAAAEIRRRTDRTPDLQQRKARMLALADAFVILPGGLARSTNILRSSRRRS